MSWTWTAADRLTFQRLRLQLARVLQDQDRPLKLNLDGLARCHRAALKAVYPTTIPQELAILRQWMTLIGSFLEADLGLEQAMHRGALSTLQGDVALILGPAEPPSVAQPVESPPPPAPYWADTD